MPLRETMCPNKDCASYGIPVEHYYPRTDTPLQACEACGGETRQLVSRFGVVFTGPITAKYNDSKGENPYMEGHWVTEKKTPDGVHRQRFIETWQQRKEFMKQEGLTDVGPMDGASDGKKSSSQGLPGCWI